MKNDANQPMAKIAQWGGCATGLFGAAILAAQTAYSGWGFVLFLVSNFFLIAFGVMIHARGFLVLQAGFTATSVLGMLNSFFDGLATKAIVTAWAVCQAELSDVLAKVGAIVFRVFPV